MCVIWFCYFIYFIYFFVYFLFIYLSSFRWVGDQDPTFKGLSDALTNVFYSAWRNYLNFGSDTGTFSLYFHFLFICFDSFMIILLFNLF